MKIESTPIKDLYVLTPTVYPDDRGYFFESYNQQFFREKGIYTNFVQDNQSISVQNVLRGLHFQTHAPQSKLVRCIVGKVYESHTVLFPGFVIDGTAFISTITGFISLYEPFVDLI